MTVVTCILEIVSEMSGHNKAHICSAVLRSEELRIKHLVRVRWDVLRDQNSG